MVDGANGNSGGSTAEALVCDATIWIDQFGLTRSSHIIHVSSHLFVSDRCALTSARPWMLVTLCAFLGCRVCFAPILWCVRLCLPKRSFPFSSVGGLHIIMSADVPAAARLLRSNSPKKCEKDTRITTQFFLHAVATARGPFHCTVAVALALSGCRVTVGA